jgi:hypothetical protein
VARGAASSLAATPDRLGSSSLPQVDESHCAPGPTDERLAVPRLTPSPANFGLAKRGESHIDRVLGVQVGLIDPEAVDQLRRVKDEPAFVAGQRLDEFVVAAGGRLSCEVLSLGSGFVSVQGFHRKGPSRVSEAGDPWADQRARPGAPSWRAQRTAGRPGR